MHHEKKRIFGEWDFGIALDYHYTAYEGEPRKGTPLKELLGAATRDYPSFMELVGVVSDHLSPKVIRLREYDVIVPVPPSNSLGSSLEGDLVFELARQLSISQNMHLFRGLKTTRNAPSLRGVQDPEQRAILRRNLYTVEGGDALAGKKVLVIDDVVSSGATLNEVVRTLRKHSAPENIDVLTLTTVGGIKRHTTLDQEAAKEMAAIHEEFSVSDDEDAYLGDGMSVPPPGQVFGR